MPKMVLNRNHVLRSILGRDAEFKKGEPVEVHPSLVPAALAIGAEMADGSSVDVLPPEKQDAVVPVGDDRKAKVIAVMEKMAVRNNRGDFSASGLPDLRRLNPMLGFDISREERDEFWKEYLATRETA